MACIAFLMGILIYKVHSMMGPIYKLSLTEVCIHLKGKDRLEQTISQTQLAIPGYLQVIISFLYVEPTVVAETD